MDSPDKALEIKAAITGAFAFVTAIIGPMGWVVLVWIFAMILDYLSGTCAALANGAWDSTIARQGLWHKVGSIAAVLVSAGMDIALGVVLPTMGVDYHYTILTPVVALWYIVTELGSIVENIDKLGAPVPGFLRDAIKKVRNRVDAEGDIRNDDTADK